MQIFIEYMGPSTNNIYAGVHFSQRQREKNAASIATFLALRESGLTQFDKPVAITLTPHITARGYDVSNYSYTYKMIEDALVKHGVIADDSAKFVKRVTFCEPVKSKKLGVMLKIEEV